MKHGSFKKNPFSLTYSEGTKITTNIYVDTVARECDLLVMKVYINTDGDVCCICTSVTGDSQNVTIGKMFGNYYGTET
jgi:hypothetical protein